MHIAHCKEGGITMQRWPSKVWRCTMHIAHCRGNLLHNANRKVVSQCGGGLLKCRGAQCTFKGGLTMQRWSLFARSWGRCVVVFTRGEGERNKRAGNAIPQFNTINITPNMNDDGWGMKTQETDLFENCEHLAVQSRPVQASRKCPSSVEVCLGVTCCSCDRNSPPTNTPPTPPTLLPHIWPSLGHRIHIPAQTRPCFQALRVLPVSPVNFC